jgi:glyoxylase-like metal-dependent hydrolase (beta-lactamase superfamily II)
MMGSRERSGTTIDQRVRSDGVSPRRFAPNVERVGVVFVNAYLVGEPNGPWALVDTGLPNSGRSIRRAAEVRFGAGRPPEAIVLTHGHVDHAGSVVELASAWDVPVYAHSLEMPFLTGRASYPPADPTVGGTLGFVSRFLPRRGVDLGTRVRALPADGTVPGMPGWRWIHTPGHTAGHVSLFRDADGVLIAGDALATVNQDSAVAMVTQRRELSLPPAPFTTDWREGRESVRRLATLRPFTLAAGHGLPVRGPDVAAALERFAGVFEPPRTGRYVGRPARTDESGIVEVPPPVADPLPVRLLAGGVAAAAVVALARRRAAARA